MKVYNQNRDKIEINPRTITVDGVTMIWDSTTEEQRVDAGYLKVQYGTKPDERYYTSKQQRQVVGGIYQISYVFTEIELDKVKSRMINDVTKRASDIMTSATVGYCSAEMASFSIMETEAISYLSGSDINTCTMLKAEADTAGVDYTDKANSVIENATLFRQIRGYATGMRTKKKAEINALSSIQECIDYEHNFVETVTITDEVTGEETTYDKYENKTKDW